MKTTGSEKTSLTSKVIVKYSLIHVTELVLVAIGLLVLRQFVSFPAWLFVGILVVLALKDLILFPFVWRSYGFNEGLVLRPLVGARATVVQTAVNAVYVQVEGELWRAEIRDGHRPVQRGDQGKVVAVEGTTLVVELIGT